MRNEQINMAPTANDVKVFVPTKDFQLSMNYYQVLGWKKLWSNDGLAEMELGGVRFFLQAYYQEDWANNFMLYISVDSAQVWYEHIKKILEENEFENTRVNPPKEEPHAIVTYAWDPCGVLLHFAENK